MGGAGDLTFVLRASDLETRATVEGDDNYNENTITSVDYFFFSDAEGTTIIKEGKATASTLSFNTDDDGNEGLKNTFYAYFLVNYPGIDHTKTGADAWTLAKLLALPVGPTDFKAESLPDFVMDSYDAGIASGTENGLLLMTPVQDNEVRNETVNLSRVAVKLVLKVNIAKSVPGNGDEVWTPEVDQFKAYFVNALTTSTVAATPIQRTDTKPDDNDDYITYDTDHPIDASKSATTETAIVRVTTPFYTYPQKFDLNSNGEPYFKIQIPWTSTTRGTNVFYYKILVSNLTEYKRNSFYTVTLNLDVIGGTSEDYVLATSDYYVAEWFTPGDVEQAGLSAARFLDIALDKYNFYNEKDMVIPVSSSHDIAILSITATKYDFKNKQSVTLTENTDYTVSTDGKKSFKITHELDTRMYTQSGNTRVSNPDYDCSPITFTVRVKHSDNNQQHIEDVTVIQYPPIYIEEHTSNGSVFVNGQSYSSNRGNRPQGQNNAYYVYNNGTNWGGGPNTNYGENIGVVVQPSSVSGGTGDNNNTSQYNIFVSVLPSTNPNVIGDTRAGGTSIGNLGFSRYSTTQNQRTVDNTVSSNYQAAGRDVANVIAPSFKIASSYGKTTQMGFERARERCASYQENGYPAGRWRLPTAAEVDFVVSLAQYSHIPSLFEPHINNGYWCSNGAIYSESAGGTLITTDSTTGNRSVRCVYDVWYWGDTQDSSHMTSWGGFQM